MRVSASFRILVDRQPIRLRDLLFLLLLWTLLGTLSVATAQVVEVRNGTTVTLGGGSTWSLEGSTLDFGSTGETARLEEGEAARATGGKLIATRVLDAPTAVNPAGLGVLITSGATLGTTTVVRGHAVQTGGGNESIARYYDISPSLNGGLDATLTFTYADGELNGLDETTLTFFRSTDGGTSWMQRDFDQRDATANRVTLQGIDALSRWTLGSSEAPLPVELSSLRAEIADDGLRLFWETGSETNNAGFEVERRIRGEEWWAEIGFVEGHGTTVGTHSYVFFDRALPYTAPSLQYRLKQVDLDGTFEYYPPVDVVLPDPSQVTLHGPFPNPAQENTTIRYELSVGGSVSLVLFDTLGRPVREIVRAQQPRGRKEITIDTSGLPNGLYFVRLVAGGQGQTQTLTVVR